MRMPEPDAGVILRKSQIIAKLQTIVLGEGVLSDEDELRAYECDGVSAYRQIPLAVVLPKNTRQVSEILKICHKDGVKVVPRGAGTSLSGGALPVADGIVLGMGKFNRILEIDYDNRCVVTQPGVTNLGITDAVQGDGFFTPPTRRARSPAPSVAMLARTREAFSV
jgi:glycolate oxidase